MAKKESSEIAALRAEIEAMKVETKSTKDRKDDSKRRADKYGWKKIPPAEKEPRTKQSENRTYHWCDNQKAWTLHKVSECKGINYRPNGTTPANGENNPVVPQAMSTQIRNKANTPLVQVREAMQTIVSYTDDYGH
jgi:hypothetical protein